MEFSYQYFFDLQHFQHKSIFDSCTYVWEVLSKIKTYLFSFNINAITPKNFPAAHFVNPDLIFIGKGTKIEPGAYIEGPCIIGENCQVRHSAYIRGNFICGDNCVIGHDTEIKNSIMLNNCHAAHFAYVGDSILGNNVNLGAGSKCANLRFDGSKIFLNFNEKKISTNLRKFGAIIGDRSQLGCNSVTNPGTLIGKNCFIGPLVNVSSFIKEGCFVKKRDNLIIEENRFINTFEDVEKFYKVENAIPALNIDPKS
jgi:NDP-sugar pyrophosphorylase family protein